MVTEDRQTLRRERPHADMHRKRQEFAGDSVKIRDHQEQPLRRGERRGPRRSVPAAVHGEGVFQAASLRSSGSNAPAPRTRPGTLKSLLSDDLQLADLDDAVADRGRAGDTVAVIAAQ